MPPAPPWSWRSPPRPGARLAAGLALAWLMLTALAGPVWAASAQAAANRPAGLAGAWYPAPPETLAGSLDAYLALGHAPAPPGRVKALLTPHAGHIYSGRVAGAAWALARAMEPPPATVILVGPSHYYPLARPSLWLESGFDTPLGPIALDGPPASALAQRVGASFNRAAELKEHSLEVQMPFLRRVLPQAKLVTVLTGPPDWPQAQELGQALAQAARRGDVLLVASSDLSHYHDQEQAQALDAQVAARVRALDAQGLLADEAAGRAEACGVQALAAVMLAARELGATQGVVLVQDDSSRSTGDRQRVVGYMAAAFTAPEALAEASAPGHSLDRAQQVRLRALAQAALAAAVGGQALPDIPRDDLALSRPAGVFVTLKQHGELRGCIGTMQARQPLAQAVVAMAAQAALADPRFEPVGPAELPGLELEISVLSPLAACRPEEVRVGVDGLLIEGRGAAGVLLPQVPLEQGWDREQYLEGLCRKAGLPRGAWRDPQVSLRRFQAQVF